VPIARSIASSSAPVVTLCGGEPLLVPDIGRIAAELRLADKRIVLNTNGKLLRKQFSQNLDTTFDVIGISIDGATREQHQLMRGARADHQAVIDCARWVAAFCDVKLKVGSVISAVNISAVADLAEVINELRPAVWRLYQYSSRGRQNKTRMRHDLTDGEFLVAADLATRHAPDVRVISSTVAAGTGCLIVDPSGDVLQPEADRYTVLGNCILESIDSIWKRYSSQDLVVANKKWLSLLE
jgi:MoaA/NifB/PqqE/SkfB family radical SAM enzyme